MVKDFPVKTEIKWYRSAVKGALIIKAGILEEDAEKVIKEFDLDAKMKDDPEMGFHYDPEELADEMIARGMIKSCVGRAV